MTTETMTDKQRWTALYVLCTGMLMIVLDITVVNVALPSIKVDLGFSQADLAWVVNGYLIAFGGLLLLSGRLGDLLGRRDILLIGLAIFVAASVLCGVAQSQEVLVGARFIQGVGGAMASAVILGMIVTMFPEPAEQAKAIGVFAFVASAGGSIGLLAGGVLTESINWHWIFFINVPIGVATAVLVQRLLPRDKGIGFGGGADVPGAVLITSSLMLGVYTIVKPAAEQGWGDPQTLILSAISLGLLALFIIREATASNPLMPLRIFRERNIAGANIVQALGVAGMFGTFFLGSLYLEQVKGYSPLEIGVAFLPGTLIMGMLSIRYSDRLVMKYGPKTVLVPGLLLIVGSLLWFSRIPVDSDYVVDLLPLMVLLGLGAGTSFPALMKLAMSSATPQDAGLASGLVNTSAQVGGAIGLAVLATVSASRTETLAGDGESAAAALTGGFHTAFLVAAALVVASIVVAVFACEEVSEEQMMPPQMAGPDDEDDEARMAAGAEPAYSEA
jgi:EmrB/QacA subfamily drug resistance transporter